MAGSGYGSGFGSRSRRRSRLLCASCVAVVCLLSLLCVCVLLWRGGARACPAGEFPRGAVAADTRTCSNIGRDMLLKGGSAVDAAISALLCTALMNPQSMGLGGGAIFTIMDQNGKVTVISSRETVPKHVPPDLLKKCPKNLTIALGPQWVGVPGELRGYAEAHRLYGKLAWAELFQPSIQLARDGFPMPLFLGHILQIPMIRNLVQSSTLCEVFCHPNKTVLGPRDILRYPKLAETLGKVAEQGAEAFYTGVVAEDLIHDVKTAGGTLSLEDLSSFKVRVSEAVTVPLGEYTMHIPPPPSGGALLTFILNIMHGFGLSPASLQGEQKTLTLHRYIEAFKFVNGQRRNIKDPQYNPLGADHLTQKSFADRIRGMISSTNTHPPSYYNITPSTERSGTTHVSVIAEDGSAVSVTSTINHIFGSGLYSPSTGIILNNELADFCGRADSLSPGEQPPSSMSPAILHTEDREKMLVIGGSGGSMITTAMAQSIMNHLWFGMSLKDAIDAKVVYVDPKNSVMFEPKYDKTLIEAMQTLGHDIQKRDYFFNVVNGVVKEQGCIDAVSDGRKFGQSAGY